jgi:hypothetical protein
MPQLTAHGLRVEIPTGWDARIYRRAPHEGARTAAVVHAGNFPLPPGRGDFGSGAVEVMSGHHVLVVLMEHGPESAGLPLFAQQGPPTSITAADVDPNGLQRGLPGQGGLQRFFTWEGRPFVLYVVLGSYQRRARLVPVVNAFLRGLTLADLGSSEATA